jgi:uncharacterized repeat protein (TIGR01451 family)
MLSRPASIEGESVGNSCLERHAQHPAWVAQANKSGQANTVFRGSGFVPSRLALGRLALFCCFFAGAAVSAAYAQVALDASTNASGRLTRFGTTLTFAHTSTGSNLVLVVGVSMNISARNTTTVSGITYNGVALARAGFHNNAGNARRSEIWYLAGPATGNHPVVVTLGGITGGATIGTVAGATTFTGADQTSPIRTYASNDGASDAPNVDVASGPNDMVLDTLAIDGNHTVTSVGGTQATQWNTTTWAGFGGSGSDVYGFGSARAGAPSVPMSEGLSASSNWSVSGVSVQPLQGDLNVAVTGSSAPFPSNLTYTISVSNSGPSSSAAVVLTDTLASGLTPVSAVPSQGICSGITTIACSLGSIATSSNATITVTATPAATGGYPNTASVTASTPDLNPANNSSTGVAYSELTACVVGTGTAGGSLTSVINTYYPGSAPVNAGSTSVTLGTATGATTPISPGDLLLIIQMQDAAINSTNTSSYGDGISGSGSTNLNNSGVYEYVNATSTVPLTGGTLTFTAAGPGGGLLYTYTAAAATSSQGGRAFQVIRVPKYATATLTSGLTASAWNGSTGGVLALDVSGTLTLNSATVSVDGMGFRGAAGLQLNGTTGATNSDYVFTAPTVYDTPPVAGADGSKGEGIAGTPEWVETSVGGVANTNQSYAEGYPAGSMARGAPGNAGGGSTDGNPSANDQNGGGGGGGNGGAGGSGGNTWNSDLSVGGAGGAAFPAGISRVALGGGGGAGSRNNSDRDTQASSGASGGGIVMIRAGSLSGSATISANGNAAYNATPNDGGGGGGAGGSIIVLWSSGVGTGLTLNANGGRGGDAWDIQAYSNTERHGPGGGGGGGVVLTSGSVSSVAVTGGANGVTLNTPGVPYGATAGASGFSTSGISLDSSPGPHLASICTDVAITKSGTPSPVLQNQTLTYTVAVTNNGPSTASGVQVVDTLPSQVTYSSASPSQGSCSQAAGVVTCNLGTMLSTATATISIVTTATVGPALVVNTAVVNSGTPDPDLSNNTATVSIAIETPTSVKLVDFTATNASNEVVLAWRTGGEFHNLGFNVYRQTARGKVTLNPSLIAGSALLMRDITQQHGAKSYAWIDHSPTPGASYWLEDVELDGSNTMHGPVVPQSAAAPTPALARALAQARISAPVSVASPQVSLQSRMLTSPIEPGGDVTRVREAVAKLGVTPATRNIGFQLAGRPAVKILVDHEGWYRITQPQLVAAGLSRGADAASLHLYAEGVEQAMRITGGPNFGPQSAIEFYGTGIDTPYSGERVYWLAAEGRPGLRINAEASGSPGPQAPSFLQTLEIKPRTTYFAALLRDDTDNFFGPLISPSTTSESLTISNLAPGQATLAIAIQGLTAGQPHDVMVAINSATLGSVNFNGQLEGKATFAIPSGVLVNGTNTISLTSEQGSNDLSLLDYIDVGFPHTFTAESDQLKFTAMAGSSFTIAGFTQPPTRLVDISDPSQPLLVDFHVTTQGSSFALDASVPWTFSGMHTLLALSDSQIAAPTGLRWHSPSNFHAPQHGAEVVMLTAPEFAAQILPLKNLRQSEGYSTALIRVDAVYDEFNFGERSPYAIRDFLQTATAQWKNKPRYLLLAGDASVDPRNYLGFGFFDFVPTKIVVTSELKTASDDWFSDFDNTGFAKIATGRLPARTPAEAQTMVSKIIGYATGQAGDWVNHSLLVADVDDPTLSFTTAAQSVQNALPQQMIVSDVFTGTIGVSAARQQIVADINAGQDLVNYNGHGSVEIWGSNLFDDTAASALTNGSKLPLFVAMNCLNGFFHDVYTESLAETLMLSNNGGAVAVWASSGLTAPDPQFQMDQTLVKTMYSAPGVHLGDAVAMAKSTIADQDVRKTFILFGDPLTIVKQPSYSLPGTFRPLPVSPTSPIFSNIRTTVGR